MSFGRRPTVADAHLVSSTLLSLSLVFFASTGFMARHREWFHPRVDRQALSDAKPLDAPCDGEVLTAWLGVSGPAVHHDGLWWVDVADARWACLEGAAVAYAGRREPAWRLGETPQARRQAVIDRFPGRMQEPPRHADAAETYRLEQLGGLTTVTVDEDGTGATVWLLRYPTAFSLIEAHRGRGASAWLVDGVAALSVGTAATGLWLLGKRTRRRRALVVTGVVLAAVVVTSVALF
ncbi:MAG: hypothetical protein RLZZ383_207 [Pseudomonadota bacterium]